MCNEFLLSCVCVKYPDRVLNFGGAIWMMIEPVYNDAVVIVIKAAAEIEIGRIVDADGGVVVILVGLSYLLIDVVLYIEIERFSILGNIEDSLNNCLAVCVDEERETLIYQRQHK